jgi:hypothetical protein
MQKFDSAADGKNLKARMDRMRVGHLGVLVRAREFVQRFRGKAFQSAVSEK